MNIREGEKQVSGAGGDSVRQSSFANIAWINLQYVLQQLVEHETHPIPLNGRDFRSTSVDCAKWLHFVIRFDLRFTFLYCC